MDSWINWADFGSECAGVDQRVIDFFRDATNDGVARYESEALAHWERDHALSVEVAERAELARLQEKYGATPK